MPAGAGDQRIPLSGMRRVIAERLLASKTTIPHFYLNIEVDAGPLMKFRAEANAASEAAGGAKLTVNDFVLKAVDRRRGESAGGQCELCGRRDHPVRQHQSQRRRGRGGRARHAGYPRRAEKVARAKSAKQ